MRTTARRLALYVVAVQIAAAALFMAPVTAHAASTCATSGSRTLCVTVPDGPLAGPTTVKVTSTPNSGTAISTWVPSGGSAINLITQFVPSPSTGDYSFVWPTQKYLDASGVLKVQAGSGGSSTTVSVSVTLGNGNATDFVHSPSDWASFLPGPSWTASRDPIVAAVGDGPSDEPVSNSLANAISASSPDLFLFLGDIYENGTFTENLNHYGQSSMDGGSGTLWGQMGAITQPTIGNHEAPNKVAWQDYFHGRPLYTSFRFGNVLFFDLASSSATMASGSAQYNYVKSVLTSVTDPPPPCIVSFWHIPARKKGTIRSAEVAMWKLLADNGGDLVLNGHMHSMVQYLPLNDQLQAPSAGQATMIELINGAGGHKIGGTPSGDSLVEWAKGKTPGTISLTLEGAAAGGTPIGLSWAYRAKDGTVLHSGARACV